MVLRPLPRPDRVLAGVPVYFSPRVPPGTAHAVTGIPGAGRTGMALLVHSPERLAAAERDAALRAIGRDIARPIVEAAFRAMGVATVHEHAVLDTAGVPPTSANLAKLRAMRSVGPGTRTARPPEGTGRQ